MSQSKFTYQQPRSQITATGLNSTFSNLANATNGTSGRIDTSNVRTEGFNRNHVKTAGAPNISDDEMETAEEIFGNNVSFTGVWTTTWDKTVNLTIQPNEVLRIQYNPLVNLTFVTGAASVVVRANSAFYIQHYITVGGSDFAVSEPFGYNTIVAGDGNTGTSDNKTLFYERLPTTSLFIPNVQTVVTAIKAKIYFDDGLNYEVRLEKQYGLYVHHRY
jgi:hypothetical protein